MASRLPGAVDTLRKHLRDAIPDNNDLQMADGMILDLVNSLHDGPDDDVGEAEGRKVDAAGRVAGEDSMPPGMGLDRAIWPSARPQGAPLGLRKLFAAYPAPPLASSVR
jgi:hypothetical protein